MTARPGRGRRAARFGFARAWVAALFVGLAFGAPALAQLPADSEQPPPGDAPAPEPPGSGAWQVRTVAELQALDKLEDRSAVLHVPVGHSAQFERLGIIVRACLARPPGQPADAAAFLIIVDPQPGAPAFRGWMLSAEPFVSMLQHPAFDVRVLACR